MKVVETEKVVNILEKMKKYMPRVVGNTLVAPHGYLAERHIDMIIEKFEQKSFEIPDPDGEKE